MRLWDLATGDPLGDPLTGHTGPWAVAFACPRAALLATASWDRTVRLWDLATGTPAGDPLTGHTGLVWAVAFARTAGPCWPPAAGIGRCGCGTWRPAPRSRPLTGHTAGCAAVAIGPARRAPCCATASEDRRCGYGTWPPATPVGDPLTGHTGPVRAVAFAAVLDGRPVAVTGGWDGTVRLCEVGRLGAAAPAATLRACPLHPAQPGVRTAHRLRRLQRRRHRPRCV